MVEVIAFDPVEALVTNYLYDRLGDGTDVSTNVPIPRKGRFVTLSSAGGGDRNIVLSSRMVIIQAWDNDEVEASRLAEACFAIMKASKRDPAEPRIREVLTVSTPYSFRDPESKMPRYQWIQQFDIRGHVLR